VVVDLESTASMMVAYAISRADLVVVPTQGSQLDAVEAVKAIRLIRQQEKAFNKKIRYAVLFTRTSSALKPRTLRSIQEQFVKNGVLAFETQIHKRDAYCALFSFGGTLSSLHPAEVRNIDAAIVNARAFAGELIAMLRDVAQPRAETQTAQVA
jgi:chromosome partitioning protein